MPACSAKMAMMSNIQAQCARSVFALLNFIDWIVTQKTECRAVPGVLSDPVPRPCPIADSVTDAGGAFAHSVLATSFQSRANQYLRNAPTRGPENRCLYNEVWLKGGRSGAFAGRVRCASACRPGARRRVPAVDGTGFVTRPRLRPTRLASFDETCVVQGDLRRSRRLVLFEEACVARRDLLRSGRLVRRTSGPSPPAAATRPGGVDGPHDADGPTLTALRRRTAGLPLGAPA